ncbi:FAD-binding oxidoreductase, partial [Streptomyces sp. SID14478]|uniref:NAD(P)/FAD-dependent oxidoreductase n=1 Tax=Streptomyces sp. SID14478 TaxID=2706073 RepID=UPI0013DAABC6
RGARVVRAASGVALVRSATGRVTGVTTQGTGAKTHAAGTVVLAAGTGTRELVAPLGIDLPVSVSPACRLRLTAPPGLVRTILARPDLEVREVRDGELLAVMPYTVTPHEVTPHEEGPPGAALQQAARRTVERLRSALRGADGIRLRDVRVGHRPLPAHGPLVGPAAEGLYVAVMHSAISLAPTAGRLVAEELTTGRPRPELDRCRP